jgi:hypothetical protein
MTEKLVILSIGFIGGFSAGGLVFRVLEVFVK